jgi:hypothetical protein
METVQMLVETVRRTELESYRKTIIYICFQPNTAIFYYSTYWQHVLVTRPSSGHHYIKYIYIYVLSQTQPYFITQLTGNTFRSPDRHQAIIT